MPPPLFWPLRRRVSQSLQIGRDGVRIVPQNNDTNDRHDGMRDHRTGDARHHDRRDHRSDEVSESKAIRIAKGEGLRSVDSITKTRDTYRIAGVDRRGHDIRVEIDRQNGDVLNVR